MKKLNVDLKGAARKNKVPAVIVSICLVILGVLMVVGPFVTGAIFLPWIIVGLFGLAGLVAIVRFIFPGKDNARNGGILGLGIILVLLSAIIILCGVFAPAIIYDGETYPGWVAVSVRMIVFFSIIYGIASIVKYVFALFTVGHVEKDYRGWNICGSILGLLLSILMVVFPWFMWNVGVIVCGVTIFIEGIVVLTFVIKESKNNTKDDVIDAK